MEEVFSNKLFVLFCDIYVSACCDTHIKLSSSKANHALICLSTVVYLKDYRWGCEALKPSIWYAWPHQSGVFVWVVFGSARLGHCWAEVCDSAVAGQSSWSQLHYTSDKQMKNNKKCFISCFSVVKYTCGKIWKDSALPRQCMHFSCVSGSGRARVHDRLYTSKYVHNMCDNVFPKDFWAHSTGANVHSGGRTEFKWSSFKIIKLPAKGILPLKEESGRVHSL